MIDKPTKKELGKKGRRSGKNFELEVRHHLEEEGWFVTKFSNIIKDNKMIHAPHKFIPFRGVIPGQGFPDFICWRKVAEPLSDYSNGVKFYYEIIGVESKKNKYLSPEEKIMVDLLLKMGVFSFIRVYYKKKRGELEYYVFG